MAGQKPRHGWIYCINSHKIVLQCKQGHTYLYNLPEPSEVECQNQSCKLQINSSHVFRGTHLHIIWTSDQFQEDYNYIDTFTVIPLTSSSRERDKGLPTVYPVRATTKNSLDKDSFAIVHQIYTVDANSFKHKNGDWLNRIGQIEKQDKEAIKERLKFFLGINENPGEDWFAQNATPELLFKVYFSLPKNVRIKSLEELINTDC